MRDKIKVEVAYALEDEQIIIELEVEEGATAEQAVIASEVIERFPEIELESVKMGVFGKVAKRDRVLLERDRVEIYRPLIADPKEVRKARAAAGKKMGKG
ncbi:MAG: RnfH family protein [Thiotrichales bacterium]|nr:RnfH family protein [Thiotrichales bacterium]MBT3613203.1 RnfH family protein [Thiotrichales bacterium]MBT3751783.1 RnfH family protein [Thiotrichales bacterium]MBT3837940.1 RnfH family protein [Thiotrichales bacterium]MBT4151523.1 RnfH family protein [Thiotrichales bacterium]